MVVEEPTVYTVKGGVEQARHCQCRRLKEKDKSPSLIKFKFYGEKNKQNQSVIC